MIKQVPVVTHILELARFALTLTQQPLHESSVLTIWQEQLQSYATGLHEYNLQYKHALQTGAANCKLRCNILEKVKGFLHVPAGCNAAPARNSAPVFPAMQPEGQQITYATEKHQCLYTKVASEQP